MRKFPARPEFAFTCMILVHVSRLTLLSLLSHIAMCSQDNVGMTPLHWACTESSIPHVALLWKKGADVESRDASGCTPLLIAAQYGQVEVVAYLLKNGANIMAVDSSRDTALHWVRCGGVIWLKFWSFFSLFLVHSPTGRL
jgi:ankyrin repeat protein